MSLKFLAVGLTLADAARPALRVRSSSSLEANALVANQPESQLQASSGLSGLLASVDVPLLLYFAFWYLGNYYYTLSNKRALVAAGGKKGFPMTISTLQLGVGVLYALFTLLFSGFLANANHLPASLSWLPWLSLLRYNFELVMSNELLYESVTIKRLWPGDPTQRKEQTVTGRIIVNDYLGFNSGWAAECARVIPHGTDQQVSACWFDLYIPALWFAAAVVLACVLLKCVRDPH